METIQYFSIFSGPGNHRRIRVWYSAKSTPNARLAFSRCEMCLANKSSNISFSTSGADYIKNVGLTASAILEVHIHRVALLRSHRFWSSASTHCGCLYCCHQSLQLIQRVFSHPRRGVRRSAPGK